MASERLSESKLNEIERAATYRTVGFPLDVADRDVLAMLAEIRDWREKARLAAEYRAAATERFAEFAAGVQPLSTSLLATSAAPLSPEDVAGLEQAKATCEAAIAQVRANLGADVTINPLTPRAIEVLTRLITAAGGGR